MEDGFKTLIDFGQSTTTFKEKSVTPPPLQGGGANDVTTMRNTRYRTKAPKKLLDVGEVQCNGEYDPACYSEYVSLMQVNQLITLSFPDDSTVAFWGWLDSFAPGASSEGGQPEATITIIVSNRDAAGDEIGPVYTAPV